MKVLFLRFSSIGDIVLTFPVLRAVHEQIKGAEIHFATKSQFQELVSGCSAVDKIHTFESRTTEVWADLKKENFSVVIDLHNNIRSRSLTAYLAKPTHRFPKLNVKKWLLVNLKWDILPSIHVVDRYFQAVFPIGVKNSNRNNQLEIPKESEILLKDWGLEYKGYVAFALGAQFKTKQLPLNKLCRVIEKINDAPVVLLGGKAEEILSKDIIKRYPHNTIVNLVGQLSILESAYVVKNAASFVTNDTGLMHIASCFSTPIHLTWGNTVRKFGMYAYRPENAELTTEYEVQLSCRPCSKIGYDACPKGHQNCMNLLDEASIIKGITEDLLKK